MLFKCFYRSTFLSKMIILIRLLNLDLVLRYFLQVAQLHASLSYVFSSWISLLKCLLYTAQLYASFSYVLVSIPDREGASYIYIG